jgi:hypothetical protein
MRKIGSRNLPYSVSVALSFVAKADSTARSVCGVTSSIRPTNTRVVATGEGAIVKGRTESTNVRGTM